MGHGFHGKLLTVETSEAPVEPQFHRWLREVVAAQRLVQRRQAPSSVKHTARRWWWQGSSRGGDGSKRWYLVNPKIAGKWMFIPLKMVLIGIDPYPGHPEIFAEKSWISQENYLNSVIRMRAHHEQTSGCSH